jgi:hypothetical protein
MPRRATIVAVCGNVMAIEVEVFPGGRAADYQTPKPWDFRRDKSLIF